MKHTTPSKAQVRSRKAHTGIRSSDEYKAWLVRFAERERATPSQLIDLGLAALAKARRFESPPPR